MVLFWFTKVKLEMNEVSDVPERYYGDVFTRLVEEGYYDENGNRL